MHKKESFCLPINFFCALPGQGDAGSLSGPGPRPSSGFLSLEEKEPDTREGEGEAGRDYRGDRFLKIGGIGTGFHHMDMSAPGREGHSRNGNSIKKGTKRHSDIAEL